MRITGDNDEGKAQLDNFIDPESTYPVIATTSRLMSTGVDAQTCQLIVLDRRIASMTEFKQIIGRGTRINEDYGKLYFTIMDFKRRDRLFADPISTATPCKSTSRGRRSADAAGEDLLPEVPETPATRETAARPNRIALPGGQPPTSTTSMTSRSSLPPSECSISDADGKLITESLKDYTRKTVQQAYHSLDAFLTKWNGADRKHAIVEELANPRRVSGRAR